MTPPRIAQRFTMFRVLLTPVLLPLTAVAAPVPKAKAPNYFPMSVGNKWVWERNGTEESEEVTKATTDGKQTCITTIYQFAPNATTEMEYVVKDGVVWLSKSGKSTYDPPQRRVDLALVPGAKWESNVPVNTESLTLSGEMVAGEEEKVKTPAGTFTTVPVTWTIAEANSQRLTKPLVYTYWYVDGIGPVKVKYDSGEKVLKSFTPGSDARK